MRAGTGPIGVGGPRLAYARWLAITDWGEQMSNDAKGPTPRPPARSDGTTKL